MTKKFSRPLRRGMLTSSNSIQKTYNNPKQKYSALKFLRTLKTIGILGKNAWIEGDLKFINTILVKYE